MNKPTFTLGNSLIIFASLAMFISVMSLNVGYSNIQSFTTADLTEYTQLPAEINKPVIWINDDTQQTVETEPPEVVETDTSEVGGKLQKTVTVSSDIHYENILTYSSVPDLFLEQVKLFWMIDGIKTDVTTREDFNVTFYDENSDNLIDKISWIIPHLSEQEFILEFDITVINPWTVGESGGDWIVYFTTTGTGTLNITQDELSNQVLTFNYLKCGETMLYPSVGEYSYIIENYSCSEIAEISHTIGQMPSGVFGMQFDFGNDFNNDVDFAYDPLPDPDSDGDGFTDFEENVFLKFCDTGGGPVGSDFNDPNLPVPGGNVGSPPNTVACQALQANQCLNKRMNPIVDADSDCLSSEYETFGSGTNDAASDTDGGGESDYSEVVAGRDPNNAGDDVASNNAPVWVQAIDHPTVNEDVGTTIVDANLLADGSGHCTDADGDTLTFSVVSENVAEVNCDTVTPGSEWILHETPAANWYGTASCTIRCDDGNGGTADDVVAVIVDPVNDPPVLTGIPDSAVNEDSGLSNNHVDLYVYHSDVDGSDAATTFSITSQSASSVVNCVVDSDRYLDCTTQSNQNGASSINITATDTGSATDTDVFVLTVNPVNDAPTSGTPTISPGSPSDADDLIGLNTSFADADGDTLTAIYDWRFNGASIAQLNVPMDTDRTSIRDYSSTATNGTATNSPTFTASCKSGGCFNFDGTNDYINFGDITTFDGADELTISAWAYDDLTSDAARYIVGKWYSGDKSFKLYTYGSDRDDLVFSITDGITNCQKMTTDNSFSSGNWHHVVAIWRGGDSAEIWIDGTEQTVATLGSCGAVGTLANSDESLTIGAKYNEGGAPESYWDGKIDQVLIFDRAISDEQVGFLNATNTLIYNKTSDGEIELSQNWSVSVTPNDATVDGATRISVNKTIGTSNTNPNEPGWVGVDNDINENLGVDGTFVGQLTASDTQDGGYCTGCTWSELTGGNAEDKFSIDADDGEIRVEGTWTMDHETNPTWTYQARVTDTGGLTNDSAVLTIDITDLNERPVLTVTPSDGGSSSSSPTRNDSSVTFTATATDEDAGDQYTILACYTDSESSGSCGSTTWCESSLTNSGTQATCSKSGAGLAGSKAWYMFACDDQNLCTATGHQGSGSSNNNSPFEINNNPTVSSVAISPSPAYTTNALTGSGTYSDLNGDGSSSTFKWWKNTGSGYSEISGQTTTALANTHFIKTNQIIFEYNPQDDHGYAGPSVNSSVLTISNTAPVAVDVSYDLDSGSTLTVVDGSNDVMEKGTDDSDADGDALTVTANTNPDCEDDDAVDVQLNGSFIFVSDPSCTDSSDTFDYTLSDGTGTDTGTVTINLAKTAHIGLSSGLQSTIVFNATETNGSTYNASGNNGAGTTTYSITFGGNGSTIDLKVKADQALTNTVPNPDETIAITNYKYINSTSSSANSSLSSGNPNSMTTSYVDLITNAAAETIHTMYIKFFLTVPSATTAGNYSNTIQFRSDTG